jgi:hyperosmotically inducible protein
MKKILFGTVCAAVLLAFGPASSVAAIQEGAAVKPSDKTADARITQRLKSDPTLKKYNIKASVDGSVATLTGTVATEADRTKAAELAKVEGITRVDNQLVVNANAGTAGTTGTFERATKSGTEKSKEGIEKTKEGTKAGYGKAKEGTKSGYEKSKEGGTKGVDKSKDVGSKVVDKTKEGVSKTGETITDGWITGRIKTSFAGEDVLKGSDINVDTNDHIVTLKGTVPSAEARTRAVAIAKDTEGVKNVVDRLTIGPKK